MTTSTPLQYEIPNINQNKIIILDSMRKSVYEKWLLELYMKFKSGCINQNKIIILNCTVKTQIYNRNTLKLEILFPFE
jgi:hypothetical protein